MYHQSFIQILDLRSQKLNFIKLILIRWYWASLCLFVTRLYEWNFLFEIISVNFYEWPRKKNFIRTDALQMPRIIVFVVKPEIMNKYIEKNLGHLIRNFFFLCVKTLFLGFIHNFLILFFIFVFSGVFNTFSGINF